MKAVEMVMNDVKHDPYILTLKLLTTLYSGHESVTMEDFKKFFARFETYFDKLDVQLFLKEVELLERNGLIELREIAAMIRNDVDMMPR